jgi:hypothetical protein
MLITMPIKSLGNGREVKSEVPANPILKSAQGTAIGSYTARQETLNNSDGKLRAPEEQCQSG